MTVAAFVSDSGTLSYQWYSGSTSSTTGGTPIPGATGTSYTPDVSTAGTTYYYVVVTNTNPSVNGIPTAAATSAVAAIVVSDPVLPAEAEPPVFVKDLSDASYAENENVILEVEAEVNDGGTITYQWYISATGDVADGIPIAGETGTTYEIDTSVLVRLTTMWWPPIP